MSKVSNYNVKQFVNYRKNVKSRTQVLHQLNINISQLISNSTFNPALYVTYVYDYVNSYNFATANFKAFKKSNLNVKITRRLNVLETFTKDDFKFDTITTSLNNYKYIKSIINPNIVKVLNEHYYLKNIVKWIITDEKNENLIKEIYSNKRLIPEDKLNFAIETVAKPKIIIRMFKNLKFDSLLIIFERHHYLADNIIYVPERSKFEFIKKVSSVFVEITKK